MGTIRKTTRSAQKKQSLKQNDTFKEIGTKILRTVMTVGFAMSSFMAQDVEATVELANTIFEPPISLPEDENVEVTIKKSVTKIDTEEDCYEKNIH